MTLSKDNVQIAIVLKKDAKTLLQDYAKAHHWSMSQAAALLIEKGLREWIDETQDAPAPLPKKGKYNFQKES